MTNSSPIRVLILHDDPVARAGLGSAFSRDPDLQVIDTEVAMPDMSACRSLS